MPHRLIRSFQRASAFLSLGLLGLSPLAQAAPGASLGGPEVSRYQAQTNAAPGALVKPTYNSNAQALPQTDAHSNSSDDTGGTLAQPPVALGPAPFDLGKIKRIQVGAQSVREQPLRVGNLDVLAPLVEELPLVGATVTSADSRNIPGNLNTPTQDQYFQINLPHGAPIVMTVGKAVAYVDGNQVTLRSAPLMIDGQYWLPVFSIAPLMGAATRLNPQGTLYLSPTIQSVELFPVGNTVAVTIKASMPLPRGGYRIRDGVGNSPTTIEFPGFSMGFDAGNSTMERLVAPGRGDIKGVRAAQGAFFPDMTRVVIDFKKPLDATVQSVSDPTLLALVLTPPRQKPKVLPDNVFPPPTTTPPVTPAFNYTSNKPLQGYTIVVDAGHGGYDNGAGGTTTWEKNYTLDIAKRLQRYLSERGANALLTRNGDYFVTLQGRVDFANSRRADLFISIHMNSSPSAASNGTETFYFSDNFRARFLANEIHRELVPATGRKSRGVSTARFFVVRKTWMPSVLLECAFVSNRNEEKIASDPAWRERVAAGVTRGVINYIAKYGDHGAGGQTY